jgi:hypothetical protein
MLDTARPIGRAEPFEAEAASNAQAHLMRDLLRRFASSHSRSPRTTQDPRGCRSAAASRRSPRPEATSPASWACSAAQVRRSRGGGWRCGWCADDTDRSRGLAATARRGQRLEYASRWLIPNARTADDRPGSAPDRHPHARRYYRYLLRIRAAPGIRPDLPPHARELGINHLGLG